MLEEIHEFLTGTRLVPEPDRILATLLFTDIVKSTQKAAEVGDRRWRDLIEAHDRMVRIELGQYRGREVRTTGDGVLAMFDGPERAVRCASSLVERVHSLGVEIRAGLHTGRCDLIDNDIGGIAVHIAARVADMARPNEVLVSSTVKNLLVGSQIDFGARGTHILKGVPGEWPLFALRMA